MGSIAQTVESILGASQVTPCESLVEPLLSAVKGAIAADELPACVAFPKTPAEMAAIVACAHHNQWRILPCGHGSKLAWGNLVTGADIVVSTQHLNQVIEHAEGDLTVTAQAGVSFADLQAQLLATRQFLAIDPAYPDRATLGGIVATRDTGALRQRYGGIRDMLIGVSFVRHDGQIAKAGGRVVKNVAGYDLMKLMTGSFGTLGIMTQLTLRTYPLQEAAQTVLLTGEPTAIQQATASILASSLTPVAMDLVTTDLFEGAEQGTVGLALQFQSIAAGVSEQVERLQAIAQTHQLHSQVLTDAADAEFWRRLGDTLFAPQADDVAITKLGILPAQAVPLLNFLAKTLAADSWQARIHASSGIGTLRLKAGENSVETLIAVRSHCQAFGGYLNLLEAPTAWKEQFEAWGIAPASQLMMARLQANFDPQTQFSPGRMG
ncbi:FAD-binding oxidoreductase [Leptolyngbya iicbica]|uniref:FAD-binding oxidoreductase n=2 Tax=Cyanophyceae TaxID=3028117 RepID=A0A4V2E2C6_9CYAN|nr:FAD-binding oxidoreductase [Leptolyngbya sp. LK]RZM77886.1 FAD-binding oxidoreductase [Leptolyngbya sp. LK]